jgi:tRNA G18 (ribose-2'-O)-methylase SpoU
MPVVVEVLPTDLAARLNSLRDRGIAPPALWVAEARRGEDVREAIGREAAIVVLGAERAGPGNAWQQLPRITVPQEGFDSLNVAMAGTVLAYEWWRKQRSGTLANEKSVR